MIISGMYLPYIIPICLAWKLTIAFDVDILRGRKDPGSCCDKLENATFSTNCQQTLLVAAKDEKFAYTPGFPNQFPILKMCSWGIYAKPGKRIRLEFRDFYLIGPGEDGMCDSQGVVIRAPLTGLQMGPHCGNAGLPSIISAGNYLVVDLVSNIPMTSENFRGFKMSYKETVETPSPEFNIASHVRSSTWTSDIVLTADPLMIEKLFPRATVESPKRPAPKTTTKSSRFQPPRRPGLNPPPPPFSINKGGSRPGNNLGSSYPGHNYNKPAFRHPPPSPPPTKHLRTISAEVIVAICVGSVILLAIMVVVIIKVRQNSTDKKRKERANGAPVVLTKGSPVGQNAPPQYDEVLAGMNPAYVTDGNGVPVAPGYYVYYSNENEDPNMKLHEQGSQHKQQSKCDLHKKKISVKGDKTKITRTSRKRGKILVHEDVVGNSRPSTSSQSRKGYKRKPRTDKPPSSSSDRKKRCSKSPKYHHRKKSSTEVESSEVVPVNTLQMRPPGREPRSSVSKKQKKKRQNSRSKTSKSSVGVEKRQKRSERSEHKRRPRKAR